MFPGLKTTFGVMTFALAAPVAAPANAQFPLEHALIVICADGCAGSAKVALTRVQARKARRWRGRQVRLVIGGRSYPATCTAGRCVLRSGARPRLLPGRTYQGRFTAHRRGVQTMVLILMPPPSYSMRRGDRTRTFTAPGTVRRASCKRVTRRGTTWVVCCRNGRCVWKKVPGFRTR